HLLDGVAGDEVNQQEDSGDYQPDYWQRVEYAGDDVARHRGSFQLSVVSDRVSDQQLLKHLTARRVASSAAKAGTENRAFIAAVNRCATQKREQTQWAAAPPIHKGQKR